MNEFVSWCRHLLVPFLFHALTSLHHPSFHRNDFSTCSILFILGQSPNKNGLRRAQVCTCMRTRTTSNARIYGVVLCHCGRAPRSTIGMYSEIKTNAPCPCTPPSTVETFGKEISAEACSGKEIAGLLRKMGMMTMMNNYDDTKIVKSRVSGFSRAKLEAGI